MTNTISLTKPLFGKTCNGCGYCCKVEPCPLAIDYLKDVPAFGSCPALEKDEGRYWCGLIRRPHFYMKHLGVFPESDYLLQPVLARLLGLGIGCDADD